MQRSQLIPITLCLLAVLSSTSALFRKASALAAEKTGSALLGGSADFDGDGNVDLDDYRFWPDCMAGVGVTPPGQNCLLFDLHASDGDVDLRDFVDFQNVFNPPPPATGDACAAATIINPPDDVFPFNNGNATQDGPGHAGCAAFESDQIDKDVWMCWRSPCTGMVVVETCDLTTIDSKIAVYNGCSCPVTDERLLACNDDGQSCGVQSRATFQATNNLRYLIRVGTFPGAIGGSGSIRIHCGFDACLAGSGSCFEEHAVPGCDNSECCNKVCAVDYDCCDPKLFWNDLCAAEAPGLCSGSFDACNNPVLTGPCDSVNDTPGCNDEPCCQAVCRIDPICCLATWDSICVEEEGAICRSACESGGSSESCFELHTTPGCNDPACCAEVCPRDPFCCSNEWDEPCLFLAGEHCLD